MSRKRHTPGEGSESDRSGSDRSGSDRSGSDQLAQLVALVESSISRGMSALDAVTIATDGRSLKKAHRKALSDHKREQLTYRSRLNSLRVSAYGGVVGGVGSAGAAVLTVSPGWGAATVMASAFAVFGFRGLRRLGPPPRGVAPVPPAKALPRGAVGRDEVSRYLATRTQVLQIHDSIRVLHPEAAVELRVADSEAAPALNQLVERLAVLHQLINNVPGTAAAATAADAATVIAGRLSAGCDSYDTLLAAAATLMAAPDLRVMTDLQPAADALIAYAHGLARAADL